MPSNIGCIKTKDDASVTKRIIGNNIYVPSEGMEITSFIKEGLSTLSRALLNHLS